MPLFDVAILEHPTPKGKENGEIEKLVFGPEQVVAKDGQTAGMVAMKNATMEDIEWGRSEVLVRPF